jgi:hypothetical protein
VISERYLLLCEQIEPAVCCYQSPFLLLVLFDFCSCGAWIVVGTCFGLILELSDRKARGFIV